MISGYVTFHCGGIAIRVSVKPSRLLDEGRVSFTWLDENRHALIETSTEGFRTFQKAARALNSSQSLQSLFNVAYGLHKRQEEEIENLDINTILSLTLKGNSIKADNDNSR